MSSEYVLLDVEGVTTDEAFVKNTLFPYAKQHLPGYVQRELAAGNPSVQQYVDAFVRISREKYKEDIYASDVPDAVVLWINRDRKDPPLKELQGLVWKNGYEQKDFKGHVYDDAYDQIISWYSQGIPIGIFSSGSVGAQKLLFAFSEKGDISHFFSHHFSPSQGVKRESGLYVPIANIVGAKTSEDAYRNIAAALGVDPGQIIFYSDSAETPKPERDELGPAKNAGLQTVHVIREGSMISSHRMTRDFDSEIQEPNMKFDSVSGLYVPV